MIDFVKWCGNRYGVLHLKMKSANLNYIPVWPCNLFSTCFLWIRIKFGCMEWEALHRQASKLVGQSNKLRSTKVKPANSIMSLTTSRLFLSLCHGVLLSSFLFKKNQCEIVAGSIVLLVGWGLWLTGSSCSERRLCIGQSHQLSSFFLQ